MRCALIKSEKALLEERALSKLFASLTTTVLLSDWVSNDPILQNKADVLRFTNDADDTTSQTFHTTRVTVSIMAVMLVFGLTIIALLEDHVIWVHQCRRGMISMSSRLAYAARVSVLRFSKATAAFVVGCLRKRSAVRH